MISKIQAWFLTYWGSVAIAAIAGMGLAAAMIYPPAGLWKIVVLVGVVIVLLAWWYHPDRRFHRMAVSCLAVGSAGGLSFVSRAWVTAGKGGFAEFMIDNSPWAIGFGILGACVFGWLDARASKSKPPHGDTPRFRDGFFGLFNKVEHHYHGPQDRTVERPKDPREGAGNKNELLDQVFGACQAKFRSQQPPTCVWKTNDAWDWYYLAISRSVAGRAEQFPVAILDRTPQAEDVQLFLRVFDAPYRKADPGCESYLVYTPPKAAREILAIAKSPRVHIQTLNEFQDMVELDAYVAKQTKDAENLAGYKPSLFVPQELRIISGAKAGTEPDALAAVLGWMRSPNSRFILILGSFGTGKSFLTKRLASVIPTELPGCQPLLLNMRDLDKNQPFGSMLAAQLRQNGLNEVNGAQIEYMLSAGRIILLVDGYDELAARISYDDAGRYLQTVTGALTGQAKILLTSRTQHFISQEQLHKDMVNYLPEESHRVIAEVQLFDETRVARFLANWLGDNQKAAEREALMRDVDNLEELASTPRMLSLMMTIDDADLRAAKDRLGTIRKADLYQLIMTKWRAGEVIRLTPPQSKPWLDDDTLYRIVTALAFVSWRNPQKSVSLADIEEAIKKTLGDPLPSGFNLQQAAHQVGSGSIFEVQGNAQFMFAHESLMEWTIAKALVDSFKADTSCPELSERAMTGLTADFFVEMADRVKAAVWAKMTLTARDATDAARENAQGINVQLTLWTTAQASVTDASIEKVRESEMVAASMALGAGEALFLEEADVRGQSFSSLRMIGAKARGLIADGVSGAGMDFTKADLRMARFKGAVLPRSSWLDANLEQADFSGADMQEADLRNALLKGASFRMTKLLGARTKPGALDGLDTFGAALPEDRVASPQWARAGSPVRSVAYLPVTTAGKVGAPDGKRGGDLLATGHDDGTIRLWDASTGAALRTLQGHTNSVVSVAFDLRTGVLASGSYDKTVRLWDASTGAALRTLQGHTSSVYGVTFDPRTGLLASGSGDKTLRLWDASTGAALRTLQGHTNSVVSVAFDPHTGVLASGSYDKTVRLWDASTGAALRTLQGHKEFVRSVAFDSRTGVLASGSGDSTVRLWNPATGTALRTLEGHTDSVVCVAFNPRTGVLASGSGDSTVRLWDASTGAALRILQGHTGAVLSVAFDPRTGVLASGSGDSTVRFWDTSTGAALRTVQGHTEWVQSVVFDPRTGVLASGSGDKTVRLWDASTGAALRTLEGHTGTVFGVAFDPRTGVLASGSGDKTVRLWDASTGAALRTLQGHTGAVLSVAFDPRTGVLASGSGDRTVRLWDASTGLALRTLQGHTDWVQSVAFNPRTGVLVSGSDDKTVRLWDASTGAALRILQGHTGAVMSVAFDPRTGVLASGSGDKTVRLWDASTGLALLKLQGHTSTVYCLDVDPRTGVLASGSSDNTVRLWDASTGQALRTLQGHTGTVFGVAFDPRTSVLVSGSDDKTVRLWDASTGRCLAILLPTAHGWAAFSPDGHYKLGGDTAGHFWHAINLCRFEPGELDDLIPSVLGGKRLRMIDDEPFL